MTSDRGPSGDSQEELNELIAQLHAIQERIVELAGGKVDAIVHESFGPSLLPHAQERLRESEALHRRYAAQRAAIIDALPANIALLDSQGAIVVVNQAWRGFAQANGLEGEDAAVGMNYIDVCENARGAWAERASEVAEGIRSILSGAEESVSLEYPCHAPDQKRWYQVLVSPLRSGGDGGAVVMHVDVTARKLAEEEIAQAKDRLETLIAKASVGILVRQNFKPLLANEELARIFGYDSAAAIMELEDIRTLLAEQDRPRLAEYTAAQMRGEEAPKSYSMKGQTRDGAPLDLEGRSFIIDWGGETAICAMVTDVTEERRTLEQLQQAQKLEAVGQLTGGIAHDFNNLLSVILGNAEFLSERFADDPYARDLSRNIEMAAERGSDLTQRLLAFSRQQGLEPRIFDANELITGCAKWLGRVLGEDIEIENRFADDLWSVQADPAQLENALLNLSINARDAMPGGGGLIFETANVELDSGYAGQDGDFTPGPYVMISVSDNGEGMSSETLGRVFEPFFTTKEIGKGTGLGLSMVYGFLKQSGGLVRIYSEPGLGTTVRLYLPAATEAKQKAAEPSEAPALRGGDETVLVVEDNEMVRDYVTTQIRSLGYSVVEAEDGAAALARLEGGAEIDLLFTDMMMPGEMYGQEVAKKALELRPEMKVIFTTGFADAERFTAPQELAGCPVLRKPYRRRELAQTLRETLDRK